MYVSDLLSALGQSEPPRSSEALLGLSESAKNEIIYSNLHGGVFTSPLVMGLILLLFFLPLVLADF